MIQTNQSGRTTKKMPVRNVKNCKLELLRGVEIRFSSCQLVMIRAGSGQFSRLVRYRCYGGQSLSLPLETVPRIDEGGALEHSIAGAPLM